MFFRENRVNILKYLPTFLQSDINLKSVANVHSAEHEKIRLLIQDIFNQFFIETATWGLDFYEKELEITPNKNDDYAVRRNRILLRYQANQTSTVVFLETLAKRYFSSATTVKVKEDNANYAFRIIADAISYDITGLIEALNIYKPAHLAYIIVHLLTTKSSTYYGGIIQSYSRIEIMQAVEFNINISDTTLFSTGAVQTSGKIIIRS